MSEHWRIFIAMAAGGLAALLAWLATEPVPWCVTLPSFPPQGSCLSRLGTPTPLDIGQSATGFALLVGTLTGAVIWAATRGRTWRRRILAPAAGTLVVGATVMPATCHWAVHAEEMLRPAPTLFRHCSNLAGMSTPSVTPTDATMWALAAGGLVLLVTSVPALRQYARRLRLRGTS